MNDSEFEAYFARHRRDAVLLHRPYPPHSAPRSNSKFGGLPRLPEHYEWPRDGNGTPLHFLAQIDCADIPFETVLPGRGVLFFFARDDDEQLWNDDNWITDSARVIYALDAFAMTAPRAHPDDLGPVGGGYYPPRAWRDVLKNEEQGPSVHVEWPIQPLRIDSWPDVYFEESIEERSNWLERLRDMLRAKPAIVAPQEDVWPQEAYEERHTQLRSQAHAQATGQPPVTGERPINDEYIAARTIFERSDEGALAYPQHWVQIEYAARAFISAFRYEDTHPRWDDAQLPTAQQWRDRARAIAGEQAVTDSERAAFRAWLMQLEKPRENVKPSEAPYADFVFASLVANIRLWAGDPEKSARIASHVFEAMQFRFVGETVWGLQYSQMLGHAPSAQEPLHPDDPTLCLLNLASDYGLGWMFGDVGNATFYISREDLAKRDFAKVEAEVVGH